MERKDTYLLKRIRAYIVARKWEGNNVTVYCKAHCIHYANDYYWHNKFRTVPKAAGFTAIDIESVKTTSIAMHFPNDIELSFDNREPISILKELLCSF